MPSLSLRDHRVKAAVAALALGCGIALFWLTPAATWLTDIVAWIRGQGVLGAVVYVALYVIGSVLMVPGTALSLSGGYIYGVVWGSVLVSIAATIGASCAFLVGRYIARDWVKAKVAHDPRFDAVDRAVGEKGFTVVLLARLSPVLPYFLLNYFFGLTKVRLRDFVVATWIGMIPAIVLLVYTGSLLTSLTEVATGRVRPPAQAAVFVGGFLLTVVFVTWIGRFAVRAWKKAVDGVGENGKGAIS